MTLRDDTAPGDVRWERDEAVTDLPPMFPGGNRIGREEEEAVVAVLRARRLFRYYGTSEGPSAVDAFEAAFAARMASRHALAVSSGTAALMAALAAAGVGPGDEVIVPAYTWVSTAAAVLAAGGVPVVAEIDASLSVDVEDAERQVTRRTKAIVPVHMRGAPADMARVTELARRHGLVVVEDVAQALGGAFGGRPLGSLGDLGCFSLQYNKLITSGEGGVVVTSDERLHERAVLFHDVAASQRTDIRRTPAFFGMTCRMSELQGAVAGVQLGRLESILADCRASRARLVAAIADSVARRGHTLRAANDASGDTAIALVLLCADAASAGAIARKTRRRGLPTRVLFDAEVPDLHVAHHWAPILARRSWSERGPWGVGDGDVRYDPERWARTADLLGRALHLDVSPDLSEAQLDAMARILVEAIETT